MEYVVEVVAVALVVCIVVRENNWRGWPYRFLSKWSSQIVIMQKMIESFSVQKMIRSFLQKNGLYWRQLLHYGYVVYSTNNKTLLICMKNRNYLSFIVLPKRCVSCSQYHYGSSFAKSDRIIICTKYGSITSCKERSILAWPAKLLFWSV